MLFGHAFLFSSSPIANGHVLFIKRRQYPILISLRYHIRLTLYRSVAPYVTEKKKRKKGKNMAINKNLYNSIARTKRTGNSETFTSIAHRLFVQTKNSFCLIFHRNFTRKSTSKCSSTLIKRQEATEIEGT